MEEGVWEATHFDGRTATGRWVVVQLGQDGLVFRRDEVEFVWRYGEILQTQGRYPGEQIRFERGEEVVEALVFRDRAFLAAIAPHAPQMRQGAFERPASARGLGQLAALAAAGVLLLGFFYFWGIPALVRLGAGYLPVAWEKKMGEAAAEQILRGVEICDDPELAAAVEDIMARLAAAAPDSPYDFRVTVVRHPMVNAFATPGGRIVVFGGLLEKTGDPEELAGVLAHEMQHVLLRHATRRLLKDYSTSMLLGLFFGGQDSVGSLAAGGLQMLDRFRYSRRGEEEADRAGIALLIRAGIDPRGMLRLFQTVGDGRDLPERLPSYLSTHPSFAERIALLEKGLAAGEQAASPAVLAGAGHWPRTVQGCLAPKRQKGDGE